MSKRARQTIKIENLTRLDCQFIIVNVKRINTVSRDDIRDHMAAEVRQILYEVADGEGNPFQKRRARLAQSVTEL